jgi:hypothetical protein
MSETYGRTDMHSCGCIEGADGFITMSCGPHRMELRQEWPEEDRACPDVSGGGEYDVWGADFGEVGGRA